MGKHKARQGAVLVPAMGFYLYPTWEASEQGEGDRNQLEGQ